MCVTQHASVVHTHDNVACGNKTKQVLAQEQRLSQRCVMCSVIHQFSVVPVSIFPSKAAGPSSTRLLICRNSSGSSPPTTVKPNPRLLFFSLVLMNVPFNSAGFLVKNGFPPAVRKALHYSWAMGICESKSVGPSIWDGYAYLCVLQHSKSWEHFEFRKLYNKVNFTDHSVIKLPWQKQHIFVYVFLSVCLPIYQLTDCLSVCKCLSDDY